MSDLYVAIEGVPAGVVTRTRGRLRFRYHDDYPASATPLSVTLPVSEAGSSDVTAWLENLLPDDPRVRHGWARTYGVPNTAFRLLGTQLGLDTAGAVQFALSPDDLQPPHDGDGEPVTVQDIARTLRLLRDQAGRWGTPQHGGRFSLAGAQAKTALARTPDGQWMNPRGMWATSHILKPPLADFPDHHLNEYVCMTTASAVGLPSASVHLQWFDGEPALVVQRFDRTWHHNHYARIHQEDMCQALGVAPELKYEADGGPGVGPIIEMLRRHLRPGPLAEATETFLRAQVFQWLVAGTDAHAKNYGLLLHGDDVMLAPLYDLGSGLAVADWHERELRLAMRVGSSYDVWGYSSPWARAADMWGVPLDRLAAYVADLCQTVPGALEGAASDPALADFPSDVPSRLVERITARVARLEGML